MAKESSEGYLGMLWDVGLRLDPKEDIGKYAIVWRDEFGEKAKIIADCFDDVQKLWEYREYTVWSGHVAGIKAAAIATGWGSASASVVAEELANHGIETIIRMGACGSIQEWVKLGDIIVAEAACRGDGGSREYMPLDYPAVANFEVTQALVKAAERIGEKIHLGITRTHDSYYVETNASLQGALQKMRRRSRIPVYKAGRVLAVENEAATTFVVSRIRGLKCGGIFYVTGNMITDTELYPDTARPIAKKVAKISIEAIKILEGK